MRLALALLLVAATAHAEPPCLGVDDLGVGYGAIAPGRDRCVLLATTDGAAAPFSWFELRTTAEHTLPVVVDATWRRLDSDPRSLEIEVVGGALLFRDGAWGPYLNNDAGFAWTPLPALRLGVLSSIHVEQYSDRIELSVDGHALPAIAFAAPHTRGRIGIGAKSWPGVRARIELRRLVVQSR